MYVDSLKATQTNRSVAIRHHLVQDNGINLGEITPSLGAFVK